MGVKFRCSSCHRKVLVPDEFAAKLIKCPVCQDIVRVPEFSTEPNLSTPKTPNPPRRGFLPNGPIVLEPMDNG